VAYEIREDGTDNIEESHLSVMGGKVRQCYGLFADRLGNNTYNGARGIRMMNVDCTEIGRYGVELSGYMAGCSWIGLKFQGPPTMATTSQSVYCFSISNSPGQNIRNTECYDWPKPGTGVRRIVQIGTITDPTAFPSGTWEAKTFVRDTVHHN